MGIKEKTEKLELEQEGAPKGKGSGDGTTEDASVVDVLRDLAARVECLGGCMNQLDTHVGQLGGNMDELTGRMEQVAEDVAAVKAATCQPQEPKDQSPTTGAAVQAK